MRTSSPTKKEQVLRNEQQLQEKEREDPGKEGRETQREWGRDPDRHGERGHRRGFQAETRKQPQNQAGLGPKRPSSLRHWDSVVQPSGGQNKEPWHPLPQLPATPAVGGACVQAASTAPPPPRARLQPKFPSTFRRPETGKTFPILSDTASPELPCLPELSQAPKVLSPIPSSGLST